MKSIMVVTPVHRRWDLTRLMLLQRLNTFAQARAWGVRMGCVLIGSEEDCARISEYLWGMDDEFYFIISENLLGKKYNDGHEFSVKNGWDISFQANSDQVFDPRLFIAMSKSPDDKIIQTNWLTAVHKSGTMALTYRNPLWSMNAYPRQLLEKNPRPCEENLMRMCDTSVRHGVIAVNPGVLVHEIYTGPLETVQFESEQQVTPWKRNRNVARSSGVLEEHPVPWEGIALIHGEPFVESMREHYGL